MGPLLGRALAIAVASGAILLWAFAEWLIIGACFGFGEAGCTTREWGGIHVPLQALLAGLGASASVWVILSATGGRPLGRPLASLSTAAVAWVLVVAV